jgi:hypothetical protein
MDPAVQIEWIGALAQDGTPNAIVCPTKLIGQVEVVDQTTLLFMEVPRQDDPVHKFALMTVEGGEIQVQTGVAGL